MFIKVENLNEAFVALCKALVNEGVEVTRRGLKCKEIPSAVLIEITNPIDRYVRIPERKWNKTLGWIESLWIARGDNCLDMPAAYVKNLKTFSDDGEFMRAGYGPRIRRYGDNDDMLITTDGRRMRRQYKNGKSGNRKEPSMYQNVTDQLRFVVEKFKEDIDTREAAITIHDPISDDFDGSADYSVDAGGLPLLKTKDTPCTRSIHFMVVNGKMNCYVDIRSNDIVWGFSAVNVFNFTLMQEYIAAMVGVPVGSYFHKADNLHVYQEFLPLVEQVAKKEIGTFPSGTNFTYTPTYKSLKEFDYLIKQLSSFESMCREGVVSKNELRGALDSMFQDKLFSDWAKVIFRYWTKETVEFKNPLLNELFN